MERRSKKKTVKSDPLGHTHGTPTKIFLRLERQNPASSRRQILENNLPSEVIEKPLNHRGSRVTFGANPKSDVPLIETKEGNAPRRQETTEERRLSWEYADITFASASPRSSSGEFRLYNRSTVKKLRVNGKDVKEGDYVRLNSRSPSKLVFGPVDEEPVTFQCEIREGDPGATTYKLIIEKDEAIPEDITQYRSPVQETHGPDP